MRIAVLSTGDELTTGRTLDTNANFIADQLLAIGVDVTAMMVVGDYPERIAWAWNTLFAQADIVLSTGGLGPTADDLTTETVAQLAGRPLYRDQAVADHIRQLFESISRHMPENNLKQAMFPEGAQVIPNPLGTAPGFRLEIASEHGKRTAVVLPGVPREMKRMMADEVLPWLRSLRSDNLEYRSHTFQTFGISESALDELVAGAVDTETVRVAFRAAFPQISVRITVHDRPDCVGKRLEDAAAQVRERLGEHCYGEGMTNMEGEVGRLLGDGGQTLAVAESCSGGLIGHRLTDVPGSSRYLLADVVAYDNAVKQSVLGVTAATLSEHGAVSCEVAEQMASGVRRLVGAAIGIATTGVAGPDGGTAEKPVGTVCIAIDHDGRIDSHRYQLWGSRDWIKLLTSQIALDWIRRAALGKDPKAADILRK